MSADEAARHGAPLGPQQRDGERALAEAEALFELTAAINQADGLDAIYERALAAITRLLGVERASILLYDAAGVMRFRAWKGLSAEYRRTVDGHSPWTPDITDARPILVGDVRREPSLGQFLPVFASEGIQALGFVPLLHQSRLLGKFMVYSDVPRAFGEREVRLAEAVAAQIAQAVARAQLLADERAARDAAQRSAERLARLQAVTQRLSLAMLPAEVAEIVIDEGTSGVGAWSGSIYALESDGRLGLLRSRGTPLAARERYQTLAVTPDHPLGDAVLRGEPVWLASRAEYVARYPAFEAARPEEVRRENAVAWLPLRLGERVIGALGLAFEEERQLEQADRELLLALAETCAQGLERARLYAEVREASRRKDEFLALLGHELRNPLSPILTALHLMRLKGESKTEHERQVIERQVVHLNRLVDDLLDVSRITRGMLELETAPHELRAVALRAIEMASPLLEERAHELVTDLPRELWVRVDPERFAQVIANLLTNAAKYTPPGGKVEVRARAEDGFVAIAVHDTGRGIPAEALPKLFDLFYQVERTVERGHGGLGLGLALVKSLAELHGGTVEVTSGGAGKGSEFTVRVPAAPAAAILAEEVGVGVAAAPPIDPARVRRVLVVDDIHDVADGIAAVLRAHGHQVDVCYDGPQALSVAADRELDVALLDIGLPVMDGFELARQLRSGGTRARLIAVTGYGQDLDRARTREAGFAEHLTKPVSAELLLAAIEAQPRLDGALTP